MIKHSEKGMVLYSITTWDIEKQIFTPHPGVPAFNLTLSELRQSLRMLKQRGYSCHRLAWCGDSDASVLVERTDGECRETILDDWLR